MHHSTFEAKDTTQLFIVTATYGGFVVVTVGTFLGLVTNNPVNKTVDVFYCVVGAVLYITAGALSIQHFQGWKYNSSTSNLGLTKASLSIVQGALFLVDAFFVYRWQ
ncbi:hypothetical protein AAG570_011958 [Ranatra chinensis]|uniref:DUF7775 domain-containing protein n=1 Tax=Ranatra chinensis TaxID=642074 RepID=A0ABD0YVV7_9HEMI